MKTVNEIFETETENKSKAYFNLIKELVDNVDAYKLNSITSRMRNDLMSELRKAEQSDNEFTVYRAAVAAEVIANNIIGLHSGKIRLSDLM